MPDETTTETMEAASTSRTFRRRSWPLGLSAAIAGVAVAAAVVSVVVLQGAGNDANDAEARSAEAAAQLDQLRSDIEAGEDDVAETEAQVAAMRALLQPGTPEPLQAVYLHVVAAACADPAHDIEAAVAHIAASEDTAGLPAQPGWEAAIDRDAVSAAMGDCEAGSG